MGLTEGGVETTEEDHIQIGEHFRPGEETTLEWWKMRMSYWREVRMKTVGRCDESCL